MSIQKTKKIRFQPINPKFNILYRAARHVVLYGGRSGAKSWGVAEALVYYMKKYRILVLCVRSVQKSIKDSSKKIIENTIERYGLRNEFHITNEFIRHKKTGAECIFVGIHNDPNKIKSTEGVSICWFEEAHTVTKEELKILMPTIRESNSRMFWTFNPDLPSDPISQLFLDGTLPPRTLIEKVSWHEVEEYLSDAILEEIEHDREHEEDYMHIWEGEFSQVSERKLYSYPLVRDAINRAVDMPRGKIFASLDVAREGSDSSVLGIGQFPRVTHIYEWKHSKDSMRLARNVANKLLQHNVDKCVVDAVGVGGPVADRLRELINKDLCSIIDWKANHVAGKRTKYRDRKAEAAQKTYEFLLYGAIPDNKMLRDDLLMMEYDHDKYGIMYMVDKKKLKKEYGKSPDAGDMLLMLVDVMVKGSPTGKKTKKNTSDLKELVTW